MTCALPLVLFALFSCTSAPADGTTEGMQHLWTDARQLSAPPTALADGVLACVLTDDQSAIVRLNRTGKEVWVHDLDGPCTAPPIADKTAVYLRVEKTGVLSLSLSDGSERWRALPSAALADKGRLPGLSDGRWYGFSLLNDTLFAAERQVLYALDPATGALRWKNGSHNIGGSFVFVADTASGFAILRAGGPSPYSSKGYSSAWGGGNIYALQVDSENVNRTGVGGQGHFVSTPAVIGDTRYILRQRYLAPSKVQIHHTPEGQAIGGSREPPKPDGLSLGQLTASGMTSVVDVTGDLNHQTLAISRLTHPTVAWGTTGSQLIFATVDSKGDNVVLQAWSSGGTRIWKRPGSYLITTAPGLVIAGEDSADLRTRRNASYYPKKGTGALIALSASGAELATLSVPFLPLGIPCPATVGGRMLYLCSPDHHLMAISLPRPDATTP